MNRQAFAIVCILVFLPVLIYSFFQQFAVLLIAYITAAHTLQVICVELTVYHIEALILQEPCKENERKFRAVFFYAEHALPKETFAYGNTV